MVSFIDESHAVDTTLVMLGAAYDNVGDDPPDAGTTAMAAAVIVIDSSLPTPAAELDHWAANGRAVGDVYHTSVVGITTNGSHMREIRGRDEIDGV